MKFHVRRTSDDYDAVQKPCNNAILEEIERIDIRGGKYIDRLWVMEINTLEELITFQQQVAEEIIINYDKYCPKNIPRIEIYDDYRE